MRIDRTSGDRLLGRMNLVLKMIEKSAAERAASDTEDFEIDQGNYDDTFWNGVEEGEILFARKLLKVIGDQE